MREKVYLCFKKIGPKFETFLSGARNTFKTSISFFSIHYYELP